jgi:hypothetical protein
MRRTVMHDEKLQQDLNLIFAEFKQRATRTLAPREWPTEWAIETRGHRSTVRRQDAAPDEILTRPGLQPKAVYITGS